jgi:hypothetical protein
VFDVGFEIMAVTYRRARMGASGVVDSRPMAKRKPGAKKSRGSDVQTGRLRVHDPFELIRWLALSQPDPRKALAELVQNSLDAGCRNVRITRAREKKVPCLRILDDGDGVIPELSRPEALKYVATHIGHSRKRDLSPHERLQLMTQGQYGIGLLGFWSLGEMLEIRSHLPGQTPHRLVLHRDRPEYEIEPLRGKLAFEERWTEVVVSNLTKEAAAAVAARRASDYLAGELRGQLLGRNVEVVVDDKMARGRSPKSLRVRPPRFLGERVEAIASLEIPGHGIIRLELYLTGDEAAPLSPPLALYAAGTMVADSFDELGALGLDHPPWTDARLSGLVDFPALRVAPGSRRGVIPDDVAHLFAKALFSIAPALSSLIEIRQLERAEQLDKNVIRDLQRAFRDFYKGRPKYTMLPTEQSGVGAESPRAATGVHVDPDEAAIAIPGPETGEPTPGLFPPGPLETVTIAPKRLLVELGGEARARANALDADGRRLTSGVSFSWQLERPGGSLRELDESPGGTNVVTIVSGDDVGEGTLSVHAHQCEGDRHASAIATVEVVDSLPTRSDEGLPEPDLVDYAGSSWRSRLHDGRWQVNVGHPDYKTNSSRPALKLRYLAMLFAKEVVLRSSQDPRLEDPLEQMVEVSAYADRQLTEKPPRGRRRTRET